MISHVNLPSRGLVKAAISDAKKHLKKTYNTTGLLAMDTPDDEAGRSFRFQWYCQFVKFVNMYENYRAVVERDNKSYMALHGGESVANAVSKSKTAQRLEKEYTELSESLKQVNIEFGETIDVRFSNSMLSPIERKFLLGDKLLVRKLEILKQIIHNRKVMFVIMQSKKKHLDRVSVALVLNDGGIFDGGLAAEIAALAGLRD